MTSTRTYVTMDVSAEAYAEIRGKLEAAGYRHAIHGDTLDMHGIALIPARKDFIGDSAVNNRMELSPDFRGTVLIDKDGRATGDKEEIEAFRNFARCRSSLLRDGRGAVNFKVDEGAFFRV